MNGLTRTATFTFSPEELLSLVRLFILPAVDSPDDDDEIGDESEIGSAEMMRRTEETTMVREA